MAKKVVLVVPEAPAPAAKAIVDARRIEKKGIRLGVLDNSKGNADQAKIFGVPDLPLLIIQHPLGGLDIEAVKGRADVATPQLVRVIQSHAR